MKLDRTKFFYYALLFFLLSCEFNASPYVVRIPKIRKNKVNMALIKEFESGSADDFRVAFIADTHNYYEELNRLVKTINRNGPYRFIVVAGDLTNYGLLDEYEEVLKLLNGLNSPYLVVPGNHDLLANGKKIFERTFGQSEFILDYKDTRFVFFNNNNWESSGSVPNIEWVEEALSSSTSQFKILIAHVSPTDKERFTESEINDWERIVVANGVSYFINGHNHNSGESLFGGARQITIGSPSKGSYYELNISTLGITHKKISF